MKKKRHSVRLPSAMTECCEQLRACTALGSPPESVDPQRSKDAAEAGLTKDVLRAAWRAWVPAEKHWCERLDTAVLIKRKTFPPWPTPCWPASASANVFIFIVEKNQTWTKVERKVQEPLFAHHPTSIIITYNHSCSSYIPTYFCSRFLHWSEQPRTLYNIIHKYCSLYLWEENLQTQFKVFFVLEIYPCEDVTVKLLSFKKSLGRDSL